LNTKHAALLQYELDTLPTKRLRKVKDKKPKFENLELVMDIKPMTEGQRQALYAAKEGLNVIMVGSAGSGKSFLSVNHALTQLFAGEVEKIIIVRSAVPTRDMGHLPGNLDEKADPYKAPYKQMINQLCGNGTAWDILTKKGFIEFITSSYVRGITVSNCILIVDEYVSMTWNELNAIVTRLGENTQLFLLGDSKQCDLKYVKDSGYEQSLKVARKMPDWFDIIEFRPCDIVRSEFVKQWIINTEE
jgi:phosphate starvation-inducible PhoH-like protein